MPAVVDPHRLLAHRLERAVPRPRPVRPARAGVVARSDLYSTGCLLYELLTGRPPFTGDSPVSVAYQHVSENPLPPSQVDPAVPPALDALVMKSLAKSPDDRYQTAADFRSDVERLETAGELPAGDLEERLRRSAG